MNNTYTKMTKVRMLLLALVLSFAAQAWADQGYAKLTGEGSNLTLTFYYGTPTGTEGTDYFLTDNTGSSYPGWFNNSDNITSVVFDSSFADARPTSCYEWFRYCGNLLSITDIEYLNTSEVTTMREMFFGCSGLTSLDVSSFDTGNVTDMRYMFRDCSGLTSLDGSSFDTGNVTKMSDMFSGCSGLTSLDVSNFNTSNVTGIGGMFSGCSGLTSLDVSNFNTNKVTNMVGVFSSCRGLTSLDVSNFNTSSVTNMSNMFNDCSGLTSLDVSNFNTSNVTYMSSMFSGCRGLTSLDVSNFNTDKVTLIGEMFLGCSSLTTIYCNDNWSGASYSTRMFDGCTSLYSASSGKSYVSSDTNADYANPTTGYFTAKPVGYAVLTGEGSNQTLTFYYGIPTGTEGIDYFLTDNTGTSEPGWDGNRTKITSVVFDPSFADARPASCYRWFYNFSSLTSITDMEYLNTSNVTNMGSMFQYCSGLTSLDLSNFDTSNVTNMRSMFEYCSGLTSLDVSHFNTDKVTDMQTMFLGCSSLTTIYCNDNWSGVSNSGAMFMGCTSLYSASSGKSYVSSDTNAAYANPTTGYFTARQGYAVLTGSGSNRTLTFYYGSKPTTGTVYDTDDTGSSIPGWYIRRNNITSVVFDPSFADARPTSCCGWFEFCQNLTSITGMEYLNTSEVTTMQFMFRESRGLTSLDVSHFNTNNVTDMQEMFGNCRGLTSLDVSNFNTGNVTNMRAMFFYCSSLTSLDLSNFNTGKVTDMETMFGLCSSLTSLDLSNFNTGSVTNMGDMFVNCSGLTSLDVSNFNTGNVTNMTNMFNGCRGLTSLDVSNFNTGNVTNMTNMFNGCSGLTSLDVSNFNTGNVTSMSGMFNNCSKLTHLTFGEDFSTESATGKSNVFNNCPKLRYLDFYDSDMTNMPSVKRSDPDNMFYGVPRTTVIYRPHDAYKKEVTGYSVGTKPRPILEEGDYTENVVYFKTSTPIPPMPYGQSGSPAIYCDAYYSVDKVDIEYPRAFRAASAEYSRSMTGKTYGSVILPYAFESNDDIQAYILSSSKGENQLTFAKASSVPEHTPFVFKKINAAENNAQLIMNNTDYGIIVNATRSTNAAEDTWDASTNYKGVPYEVSTSLSGWKSLGYYIREDVTDYDGLYFVQNDKFKAADGTLNLYDHRVLFRPDAAGAAKTFSLTFVDDAGVTAVDAAEVEAGTVDAAVYDASGRRIDKARRGMNIVRMSDGTIRKVVVR